MSDGSYKDTITTQDHSPYGICVDSTNKWPFVGYALHCSPCLVSLYSTNGTFIKHVLQVAGSVRALALYNDTVLAVASDVGLYLYNVTGNIYKI